MKGLNKIIISGEVKDSIKFGQLPSGQEVCSCIVVSDRQTVDGPITVHAKVNVYTDSLVKLCRSYLTKGAYVVVEGELMNRMDKSGGGNLTEIRARELIFTDAVKERA